MSIEDQLVTVLTGRWRYADQVERPVAIVGLPFDYHYELALADDQLEPGEEATPLGDDGLLYYGTFGGAWTLATGPHRTVAAAMEATQASAPSTISWDQPDGHRS